MPTKAPAIPSNMVMMQPPGSFPGINSFAMAPMTRPMTKTQMIECALKSIWKAILIREPKLVNLAVLPLFRPEFD